LAIVRLTDTTGDDPYELLFNDRSSIETTIVSGAVVAGRALF
jgi:hypothetical protein